MACKSPHPQPEPNDVPIKPPHSGKTQITAIPFRATAPTIGLTFNAGFRPQILLGIQVFDGAGKAEADFFLDLPQLSVTIEQVTNVAKNCLPSNATDNAGTLLGQIFGNLTHINPTVDLNVGVGVTLAIQVDGVGPSIETDWTIASTAFPLPTE